MTKVAQTVSELQTQLQEQLLLLEELGAAYDSGSIIVARSIATSIRVLVHNTLKSHSLLGQLMMKNVKFFDAVADMSRNAGSTYLRVGSFCGLVNIVMGNGAKAYVPCFDEYFGEVFGFVDFDSYWNRVIFIDQAGNSFTRKDIILAVSNQDGGAHVDPEIDEKYKRLARENALGWNVSSDGINWEGLEGAELAAIRQIAHEILKSLKQGYPQKLMPKLNSQCILGGSGIWMESTNQSENILSGLRGEGNKKIGRNDICPCGSMMKYKKCHGN